MRVPKVHVPYLFGVGLFGLAHAAAVFLPAQGVGIAVVHAVEIAAWALHLIWLQTIYRDGEARLGKALAMPAMRVVVVALIACVFLPLWSSFAVMVLLRSTVNAMGTGDDKVPPGLLQAAQDASALVVAGVFWVGVEAVVFIQLDLAGVLTDLEGSYRPVEILGTTQAYVISFFHLACSGYWLWFVARAIPPLYRAMDGIEIAMDRGQSE